MMQANFSGMRSTELDRLGRVYSFASLSPLKSRLRMVESLRRAPRHAVDTEHKVLCPVSVVVHIYSSQVLVLVSQYTTDQ